MSVAVDFQKLILERLVADAGVYAIVAGRIFDGRPQDSDYPCITFGPSDAVPMDMDCITAREQFLQLDCWVRAQGRRWPCDDLCDAVKAALHGYSADMGRHALRQVRVDTTRVFIERDGITAHGVVPVYAEIEER